MKTAQFTKALTIALHPEMFEQIKQITDTEHISIAQWVREAVASALNNIKREEDNM
jgi:hypothetical protein